MRLRYHFVLVSFLIFSFPFLANAQIKIGIKSGANIATIEGRYSDSKTKAGWYGGGILHVPFDKTFGLRVELLYSSKGTGTSITYYGPDYEPPKASMRFNYINIPLLLSYKITDNILLMAGPEGGYLTKVMEVFPDILHDRTRHQPEKFDFSLDVGGEFHFLEKYGFEIRYSYGIKTIHYVDLQGNPWPEKAGNRVVQIGFNYFLL